MLEDRRDLDLGEKALEPEDRAEVGIQELESDVPVVPEIAGEIDRRHSAGANLALDVVAILECDAELCDRIHSQNLHILQRRRQAVRPAAYSNVEAPPPKSWERRLFAITGASVTAEPS